MDSERTEKLFCDFNAYCFDYAGLGSYACVCKDGYKGDGKVGNCKKIKASGKWSKKNIKYFIVNLNNAAFCWIQFQLSPSKKSTI